MAVRGESGEGGAWEGRRCVTEKNERDREGDKCEGGLRGGGSRRGVVGES